MATKYLAQIVFNGTQVVGRAFLRSIRQEIEASQRAAKARAKTSPISKESGDTVTGITIQEALQVLNVKDIKDVEGINKNYKHLFDINSKTRGGSLYLQSKVVRAKERIFQEIAKVKPELEKS
ncbi:DgyrCDS11533 [Dimorphilus gyrociliatus]|uniref:DgyrCDS11533 n=1 Tax=Dimorphilus gyrociliatus TaxID=2664684 RepID=A0A7I8W3T4_9ANNE|nr:DgyrCDS11533 [Dimorphilus gyrociliatus]